jgi:hypothetical protein
MPKRRTEGNGGLGVHSVLRGDHHCICDAIELRELQ